MKKNNEQQNLQPMGERPLGSRYQMFETDNTDEKSSGKFVSVVSHTSKTFWH